MVIPENSSIVIFGASGDLTYRKLIPALYHLYASKQLPENFAILGVSRTEYSDESYREKLKHRQAFTVLFLQALLITVSIVKRMVGSA